MNIEHLCEKTPILNDIRKAKEVAWINPDKRPFAASGTVTALSMADIQEAEARLRRFAPFLMKRFPETRAYLEKHHLLERMPQAAHIAWATGGSLVPEAIRQEYQQTFL